jgi:putative tricarboxylic transport membrane protein
MKRHPAVWCWFATLLAVSFFCVSFGSAADKPKDYPARSVEMVVGYGAGGGSDLFARAVATEAKKLMKASLVVVNKPGAGGVVGMEYVHGQPADGYTLWGGSSTVIVTAGLQGTSKNQYTDFEPIIRAQLDTMMLMVKAGGKYKTIQEVIADAKARPGQQTWGVVGLATGYTAYIADALVQAVGITPKIVPFDQAGRQHAALLGGHIDVMMEEPGATVSLVEGKKVVPVVIFAENRVKPFPNVPTTYELGAKEALGIYRGVMVKKGVPPDIVRYLEEVFTAAVNSPGYKKYEQESFLDWRKGYMGSKEFAAFLKMDAERSTEFFKRTGIYQIRK